MNAILIGFDGMLERDRLVHAGEAPKDMKPTPTASDLKAFARSENAKRRVGHLRPLRKS